jgi:hypothetical protein
MAERDRHTTSGEKEILERAGRRYFTLPIGISERAAWIQETTALSTNCGLEWSRRRGASGSTTTGAGSTYPHQNPALDAPSR